MRDKRRNHEAGIALVLALLTLMLLTFLGLALAATTSTELQIANNYRWAQQAFYNAEAGFEIAKQVLGQVDDWTDVLPPTRIGTTWVGDGSDSPTTPGVVEARDYEAASCDELGGRMGYGRVLDARGLVPGGDLYNDVATVGAGADARTLRGGFTIWVRRLVVMTGTENPDGSKSDAPSLDGTFTDTLSRGNIVVTAEGVAPYSNVVFGNAAATLTAQQYQAVRTIEGTFTRDQSTEICEEMDPENAGFAKCRFGDGNTVTGGTGAER